MADAITPDLQGFRDAQSELRQLFGQDITFQAKAAATWPLGTPIDPETNEPYDPTIEPVSGGGLTNLGPIRCNVVFRPMGLSRRGVADDAQTTAVGVFEEGQIVLIADPSDYDNENIATAIQFTCQGESYTITQTDEDQLGEFATPHRILIYGEQM